MHDACVQCISEVTDEVITLQPAHVSQLYWEVSDLRFVHLLSQHCCSEVPFACCKEDLHLFHGNRPFLANEGNAVFDETVDVLRHEVGSHFVHLKPFGFEGGVLSACPSTSPFRTRSTHLEIRSWE